MTDKVTQRFIPELDGLRGLAIVLVLICHVWGNSGTPHLSFMNIDLTPLANMGKSGVILFFVLSGYLLFPSILRTSNGNNIASYFKRRFFRIVPAYYAALIFIVIFGTGSSSALNIFSHLFLTHTLFNSTFFGISGAFWSLGPEIQFYLFLPVLIYTIRFFFKKTSHKVYTNVLLILIAAFVTYRFLYVYFLRTDENQLVGLGNFPTLADSFLLGGLLSLLMPFFLNSKIEIKLRKISFIYDAIAFLTFIPLSLWVFDYEVVHEKTSLFLSLNNLATSAYYIVLVFCVSQPTSSLYSFFSLKPIQYLGKLSFGIFLWHLPILESHYFQEFLLYLNIKHGQFLLMLFALLTLSAIAGFLSYKFIEAPMINYSHRKIAKKIS